MKTRRGQIMELEITGLAFGGKGLAKINGFTIFVDQAVPGDRVLAQVVKKKRSYAETKVVELIEASPHRQAAPCPYSGFCGGCKWQFLKYNQQLEHKRRFVEEALAHIGQIHGVPVHKTVASNPIFGYRNKMEFTCTNRKWLLPHELGRPDIEKGVGVGLHVPGTFYKVFDTEACLLQPQRGNQILADIRQYIKNSDDPVYGLHSHQGFWRFVMLRHSVAYDQWMVNLITSAEKPEALKPLADALMAQYKEIVSVVNNVATRKAGVAIGDYERPIAGHSVLKDAIDHFEFEISANSFFQTNTRGAANLYAIVKQYSQLSGKETVLDLYCGTGAISIYLAALAKEVIGFEIMANAIVDAKKNCDLNQIENCRFIVGDLRQGLLQMQVQPEVVIVDPPRAGMHKDVVQQVLAMAPARIVYVSCNPATLARDLQMMKDHYHILEVQPVDMFPHTYHVESVAQLQRRHRILS